MKHLLLSISLIACITISCEKTSVRGVDLIDKWLLLRACDSCAIFEFNHNNNLLIHDILDQTSGSYYYKLYPDNTIKIEYGLDSVRHEIEIHSKNLIEIIGFSISGIPEEMNTIVSRIKK